MRLRSLAFAPLVGMYALGPMSAAAQDKAASPATLPSDVPATFVPADPAFDYVKREVMIPMRDGVKLHTVIVMPKGAAHAPILLTRTPYDASALVKSGVPSLAAALPEADRGYARAGYIRVYQDIRGKYGSEGDYVNERPLRGPLNPTAVDHSTDAWDTIDWLVKNVPESNGRVGMIGNSYDGMMVLMALVHPHPALKAAVPSNPVVNTWMGDDDFHGGAQRIIGYDYYFSQDAQRGEGGDLWRDKWDDYDTFLQAGSNADFIKSRGLEQLPFVQRLTAHPTYDDFWKAQALETILPQQPQTVPTLFIAGQWDQEDIYGAIAAFEAVKPKDKAGVDHLVLGPWSHGGWQHGRGDSLGPVAFDSDTALYFREKVLLPFLNAHLKDGAPASDLPQVLAFETGANVWKRYDAWPRSCGAHCASAPRPIYLQAGGALSFSAPTDAGAATDAYVSDPAKPIPYRVRPIRPTYADGSTWGQWLVDDQRPFSDRTDVLTYVTPPLTAPVAIAGAPMVNLVAATSGTDSDWVVKLIDVYPDLDAAEPKMSGYQLGVSMDIFRGRYRKSYSAPEPITPDKPATYRFALPNASHVFLPGHRIMVQVQSSWFPLYDRNPQTYVDNIAYAKPGDYQKATQTVFHAPGAASFIALPTIPAE